MVTTETETKTERIRCMSWNVNGWMVSKKKTRQIHANSTNYDLVIWQETHLKEDDKDKFNSVFEEFECYHSYAEENGYNGVTVGVRKRSVIDLENRDIRSFREETGDMRSLCTGEEARKEEVDEEYR